MMTEEIVTKAEMTGIHMPIGWVPASPEALIKGETPMYRSPQLPNNPINKIDNTERINGGRDIAKDV